MVLGRMEEMCCSVLTGDVTGKGLFSEKKVLVSLTSMLITQKWCKNNFIKMRTVLY